MQDIKSRQDIEVVLKAFYGKAFTDPRIGYFFTEIIPLDLETHLPLIADFWETVLFATRGYHKDVMVVHRHIHGLSQITKAHLDRWVDLMTKTIDEYFSGTKAELMKQRAASIATMMNIKLNHSGISNA
jgi:hemoglobin